MADCRASASTTAIPTKASARRMASRLTMQSNVQDFIQNVAISRGSHAFKFGGELRLIQYPFVQFSTRTATAA